MQVSLLARVGFSQYLRKGKLMASTSKTVSEKLAQYYGDQFVQTFEHVDLELVATNDLSMTISDLFKEHFPELDNALSSEGSSDEQLAIGIQTADGKRVGCLAKGTWLLIIVVTVCLVLGLLLFGTETVTTILRILLNVE